MTNRSQDLATVIVGSQLHGLATPSSDIDTFRVVASPLIKKLSPFNSTHGTQKREGDGDHVTVELDHFIKLIVSGSATVLEVLYSNKIVGATAYWHKLKVSSKHSLLSSEGIYRSHRGYASAQIKHVWADGITSRRGRKAACAYLRVLNQGVELLETRSIAFPLHDEVRATIAPIKFGQTTDEGYFREVAKRYQDKLDNAAQTTRTFEPDIELAERLIFEGYSLA